jgi:hypothetical protein
MDFGNVYSYDLLLVPKGAETAIVRFRKAVKDHAEELKKDMQVVEVFEPEKLRFAAMEPPAKPDIFLGDLIDRLAKWLGLKTGDDWLAAVKGNHYFLQFVPEDLLSEEKGAENYVPKALQAKVKKAAGIK